MVVRRTEIVFSMKLTPEKGRISSCARRSSEGGKWSQLRTQRLNIVLVETALDILDHQTCLADLGVAHHPDLDHDTV